MAARPQKIFVSYAHSSDQHKQRVADLVATLRQHGLMVMVDTDVTTPQGPPEGWPRWMKRRIAEADWILIFFDETYRRRFDGLEEPDKGLGATWEGAIITHQLYRESTQNERFIPLLADDGQADLIPDELFGATRYSIPRDAAKLAQSLVRTGNPPVEGNNPNPTGSAPSEPARISRPRLRHGAERLFGRDGELKALDEAWKNPATHVVTIVAWGGVGKTSLVAEWMARQSAVGWQGFERVFDWSFYSQGTQEQGAASGDAFVAEALRFFGDPAMADSARSPSDKGARLAELVAERRSLLVLDGLEPLQYPPGPMAGRLKDPAIEKLLKGLARKNPGLCIVTTRVSVADLASSRDTTAPEWSLETLSEEAGAALLHKAGACRAWASAIGPDDAELKTASREVLGHALTLNILGRYLAKAHRGDIRHRDRVKFTESDAKVQGGHAFRTLAAYETWLADGGEDTVRALAILRLLGLFDRPASAGCLTALRADPPIAGLTEPLMGLTEDDWNLAVSCLTDCGLASPAPDGSALDAHPLIREHFATQLRQGKLEAWRAAHKRLYEHLKDTTEDQPDTIEGLQPLYQAVSHACQADLHQEARDEIYFRRILRGKESYSWSMLGAIGADLGAVSCFFDRPWTHLAPGLRESSNAWLLSAAAFCLRAIGRLTEALQPMRAGLDMHVNQEEWQNAAIAAGNLSELGMTLGDVAGALRDAEVSVAHADRSGNVFHRIGQRTGLGDALHQAGRREEALTQFRQGETMQAERQRGYPLLYSVQGARYCDLLLAECCRESEQRARKTLKWAEQNEATLLTIALDHLTLGRAAMYRAAMTDSKSERAETLGAARRELAAAVDGLRTSAQLDELPKGFLSRAWLRAVEGDEKGARADLDEAWEIAERGPMPLHMADVLLYRARLFRDRKALEDA
ncbi:MAG: toll/interleukin-1 receptor domain-containing protein, partial [Planctomycetota bacterium]|nr:toll/interleukin-1 receptor domain-containing protein [Planctomycetota bacterium]